MCARGQVTAGVAEHSPVCSLTLDLPLPLGSHSHPYNSPSNYFDQAPISIQRSQQQRTTRTQQSRCKVSVVSLQRDLPDPAPWSPYTTESGTAGGGPARPTRRNRYLYAHNTWQAAHQLITNLSYTQHVYLTTPAAIRIL